MKSIINQLKGIKSRHKEINLRMLKSCLNDVQDSLLNYKHDNEVDELKEMQIYKTYKLMQRTDIFDLSIKEIESYIIKLINILEFIEL